MTTKIYSLQDENGCIRYIGKTIKSLKYRFAVHLSEARCGAKNHRCCWIRSVLSRGKWPSIFLIGEVEGDGCKEEIAWIKYFRDEGVKLVNGTDGGDGAIGVKFSESEILRRRMRRGFKMSEKSKKILSMSKTGHLVSDETRQKIRMKLSGRKLSEEARRKLCGKKTWMFGKHHSEESCRKMSQSHKGQKGFWFGKHRSEETKKKLSAALIGRKLLKEVCLKMSASRMGKHMSEEAKQKSRVSHLKHYENKKITLVA